MQKKEIWLPEIKLVGIKGRTNNRNEGDPSKAIIGSTFHTYLSNHIASTIPHRKNPGVMYSVYTDYESDFTGDYTYFLGEEVTALEETETRLVPLVIPAQCYLKLTCGPGPLPEICIKSWQEIWKMTSKDFGGDRIYIADFEIYDHRAQDPTQAIFDIYIGIKKNDLG